MPAELAHRMEGAQGQIEDGFAVNKFFLIFVPIDVLVIEPPEEIRRGKLLRVAHNNELLSASDGPERLLRAHLEASSMTTRSNSTVPGAMY